MSIVHEGKILSSQEVASEQFSHSEKLHAFIMDVVLGAKIEMQDLDAIAVSKGPGSYTGLRIGVSTAKGLCYALDKPLISVPTLKALAMKVKRTTPGLIVPMLDARRMEVYTATFDQSYQEIENTHALVLEPSSFQSILEVQKVVFLGDGAEKFKIICDSPNAEFVSEAYPSAIEMAVLSEEKYARGDFEDLAYFEPFYLKDFVAGKPKKLL